MGKQNSKQIFLGGVIWVKVEARARSEKWDRFAFLCKPLADGVGGALRSQTSEMIATKREL